MVLIELSNDYMANDTRSANSYGYFIRVLCINVKNRKQRVSGSIVGVSADG